MIIPHPIAGLARLAFLGAMLLLVACPRPRPVPPPPAVCDTIVIDDPSRAAALIRVHSESIGEVPTTFDPLLMPLTRATRILGCDQGSAAELRRRVAVALLAVERIPALGDRLAELRVDDVLAAEIKHLLEALSSAPKVAKVIAIYEYLFAKYGTVSGCRPSFPVTKVKRKGATVEGTTMFSVNRSVATLKGIIDPQRWQKCSVFFDDSYVPTASSLPSDCASPKPTPHGSPPTPGGSWSDTLFEQFTFALTQSWFRNLLHIDAYSYNFGSGQLFGFSYSLQRPVCSAVLGQKQDGGLSADEGLYSAYGSSGNPSTILVTKTVHFDARAAYSWLSEDAMADYAEIVLQAMGGEAATMACCTLKKP